MQLFDYIGYPAKTLFGEFRANLKPLLNDMKRDDLILKHLLGVPKNEYPLNYQGDLLEQYKLYVTLMDKISERRSSSNSLFLTMNTGLLSAAGVISRLSRHFGPNEKGPVGSSLLAPGFWILLIAFSGLVLSYYWYRLIVSYKGLNSAKFRVIHEIEQHLPLKPYSAEWEAVGRGKNKKSYNPLTHLELYIPRVWIAAYLALAAYVIYKNYLP